MDLFYNLGVLRSIMNTNKISVMIIGGGAAGIFAALSVSQAAPSSVVVLEKSAHFLTKVRISGGGRCNVTHACFDPKKLVQYYPRGGKELLGPFHKFQPRDTIAWFENRRVQLKIEEDGRMFPITDQSQTIIDALLNEAKSLQVALQIKQHVTSIDALADHFTIHLRDGSSLHCRSLILATGSNPEGYHLAETLGHTIQPPVPSLFTFNVPRRLASLFSLGLPLRKCTSLFQEFHGSRQARFSSPILVLADLLL